jgi:hypothetical protein
MAQAIIPSARIVYADNDPIVLSHARALRPSVLGLRHLPLEVGQRDDGQAGEQEEVPA